MVIPLDSRAPAALSSPRFSLFALPMNLPSPRRLLSTVLAFALSAAALPAVDIVAHRGASFYAPENTLASQKLANEQKADAVETDIWLTKDGQIIVSHDLNTQRTAGRDAKLTDLTFDEARQLDAGYLPVQWLLSPPSKDPKKPSPDLDEAIAAAKAAKLDGLDVNFNFPMDAAAVKKIRAAGLQLHVWTVDDVAVAKRWVALGVDSITTNRPGWLRAQLAQ
jgi:glycerophosphoryl diester phosphodiesterase